MIPRSSHSPPPSRCSPPTRRPTWAVASRHLTATERDRLSEADLVLREGDALAQDIASELHKLDNCLAEGGATVLIEDASQA